MREGITNDEYRTDEPFLYIYDIWSYKEKNGSEATVEKYEDEILAKRNPYLSYEFSKIEGSNIANHAKIVIESCSPRWNYVYSVDIKNADISAHAKAIIKSGDARYNYLFAQDIEGADISAHAQAVIESGDAEFNYLFAQNIGGADISAHAKAVIESGDTYWAYMFYKEVQNITDDISEKLVSFISEENEKYLNNYDDSIEFIKRR